MAPLIRPLDPARDLDAVQALYAQASAFWQMSDRKPPDRAKAAAFFVDTPPGCDPAASARLGLFKHDLLQGVAELAFGFPKSNSAYLGLMVFAETARGRGHGSALLARIERLAREKGCPELFLAVLEENTAGRAFWERRGFQPTGTSRHDTETGHILHRMVKAL